MSAARMTGALPRLNGSRMRLLLSMGKPGSVVSTASRADCTLTVGPGDELLSSTQCFGHGVEELLGVVDLGQPAFVDQPKSVTDGSDEGAVVRGEHAACLMRQ